MKITPLHQHLNKSYYAAIFNSVPNDETIKNFEKILQNAFDDLEVSEKEKFHIKGFIVGMFSSLTSDDINGQSIISITSSNYFYDENHGGPWILYDYVQKKFIDWAEALDINGPESEEYKKKQAFSCKDSLETILVSVGISKEEQERTYLFNVLDYDQQDEKLVYTLSVCFIQYLEGALSHSSI